MKIPGWLDDLFCLFFPRTCLTCGKNLLRHEQFICDPCLFHLPRTRFHHEQDNPVARTFWGRVPLEHATAFLYYQKRNRVQKLIHEVKYRDGKELGIFLGTLFGRELKEEEQFTDIDLLLPVPLHRSKLRKRGYNQSALIAEGLASVLEKPVCTDILYRARATDTQTKKSRYRRWENVEDIFAIRDRQAFTGKHLLLVDDVITTGATIEACVQCLLSVQDVKVSVVSIGYASR